MKIALLAVDLAKSVFQIHGVNKAGKVVVKRKLRRNQFESYLKALEPCTIAMESCSSAHFWGRKLLREGHEVKLISPQYVKPFVKTNKSDAADAEAIAEAAMRPSMNFVPVKTRDQQDLVTLHRLRERVIKNRSSVVHEMRAILFENGIIVPKGKRFVVQYIKDLISDYEQREVTAFCKTTLADLLQEYLDLDERASVLEKRLEQFAKENDDCKRLQIINGIGLITASAIVASTVDINLFKNGRHFAAWLGLVPAHTGTGGKTKLLGVSKRGDPYIRKLLVQGAKAVIRHAGNRSDKLSAWINQLKEKKHPNTVAIAVANKSARIAYALLKNQENFKVQPAAAA